MPNHPNRSRAGSAARNPTPQEVKATREAAGLTQTEAAARIHCTLRGWQGWEQTEGDNHRRMHPAFFHLFCILSNLPYPAAL
jgi:DNA-binding transcriptional regulator YiaG